MQAIFRFNLSDEIGVSTQTNYVLVEILEGRRFSGGTDTPSVVDFEKRTLVQLDKSQARAVASAIMGAAANLGSGL